HVRCERRGTEESGSVKAAAYPLAGQTCRGWIGSTSRFRKTGAPVSPPAFASAPARAPTCAQARRVRRQVARYTHPCPCPEAAAPATPGAHYRPALESGVQL
ncbi:MAG: hypothetical protein ACPIOQ_53635, partial [Promethearchaeia archaeon]